MMRSVEKLPAVLRVTAIAGLVLAATPALANYIYRANVAADCTGFTFEYAGCHLYTDAGGTIQFEIALTPASGASTSVTGSIPVMAMYGDACFDGSRSYTWAEFGITPTETYDLSGVAQLFTVWPENTLDIVFTPTQLACGETCSGQIGDFVWYDANKNGIQDGGEPGMAGVELTLQDGSGTPLATTTTGANGQYLFSGLCPGDYKVVVTPPAGYAPTVPFAGGSTTANDSNGSPASVTLTTEDLTIDFGFVVPPQCVPSNSVGWNPPALYCPAKAIGKEEFECGRWNLDPIRKVDGINSSSTIATVTAALAIVKVGSCYDAFFDVIAGVTVLDPINTGQQISHVTYCKCR